MHLNIYEIKWETPFGKMVKSSNKEFLEFKQKFVRLYVKVKLEMDERRLQIKEYNHSEYHQIFSHKVKSIL